MPRPDDLGRKSRHPGQTDRHIDRPGAGVRWRRPGILSGGFVGCHLRGGKAHQRNGYVQAESDKGGDRDVIDPEEVESGQQATQNRTADVPSIEEPQPRDAVGCRLHPSRHSGEGRSHEDGWRKQTDSCRDPPQQEPDGARARPGCVDATHQGHSIQHQNPDETDSKLEPRVDAQRVVFGGNKTWEQVAAQAHASHKRPQ